MARSSKPLCMVTTCGTSLLNRKTSEADYQFSQVLLNIANCQKNELDHETRRLVERKAETARKNLLNASLVETHRLSAELNGLLTWYQDDLIDRSSDQHIFLHTDTYLGTVAADILDQWCREKGLNTVIRLASDVQTRDLTLFQTGMADLVKWCYEEVQKYRDSGYRVVFNLVGGFKSFQGFLQTLGMLYADECISLFEGERELLRIPRLPLDIDNGIKSAFQENLNVFRRMGWGGKVDQARCAGNQIPETLLMIDEDKAGFSMWGDVIWDRFQREHYQRELLPSPFNLIRYSRVFEEKAAQRDNLFYELNTRIDDLARYLEHKRQADLDRLDFKKLKIPRHHSTHQCDLTADRGGLRLFGHFEKEGKQEIFIIDDLDRGMGH